MVGQWCDESSVYGNVDIVYWNQYCVSDKSSWKYLPSYKISNKDHHLCWIHVWVGREHLTFTAKVLRLFWFQRCFILNNWVKAPFFSCVLSLNTHTHPVFKGYVSSQMYELWKRTVNLWEDWQLSRLTAVNLLKWAMFHSCMLFFCLHAPGSVSNTWSPDLLQFSLVQHFVAVQPVWCFVLPLHLSFLGQVLYSLYFWLCGCDRKHLFLHLQVCKFISWFKCPFSC